MHVSEEVSGDEDGSRDDLHGDVPAGTDETEDHAEGKEDAECEDHEEDM